MHNENPLVSVVIPTRNRPELVGRAVNSVLQQTLTDLEVIVVVDGPDPAIVSALKVIQDTDSRLRVLLLPQNLGGSDARNAGIDAARGRWIALLDDDDEWMRQKLEKQLALGERSSHRYPLISCKIIGRTPSGDSIRPVREPFLPFADYAWRHRGLFQTEGTLYCPTLVGPSALFRECRFTSGLRRHQDWDWLIRAFDVPGAGLEFVGEPLVICHFEEDRGSISALPDWRYSLDWANRMKSYISPEAYAAFLLTNLSLIAAKQGDWSGFFPLLASAFRRGKPSFTQLILYVFTWLLPMNVRRFISRILHGSSKKALEN
jgi:glycosyltransferase involved in cell wall biosynthesis